MGYLIGGNTMVMMTVTNEGAKMDVRSKTRFDVGSAAAISADGYYLTAAHCVTNEPLKLVGYSGRTILWAPGVRVVWKGGDERPDLALIHVPVRPSGYFPMAGESEIQRGTQVLAGGLGGLKQSLSAGRILKVRSTEQKGVRWLDIHHDTPLEKGDSGGPIMDERGRLLGISSKGGAWSLQAFGKYWIDSRRSISIWIDPEKIRSLMEEDRKKHRKR